MPVVRVPLRKASRRVVRPTRVFGTHEARWQFVVLRAQEIHARGGAVLIGTDSVSDSQALSQRLDAAGLAHVVLNAAGPARSARHRHSRATGTHHRSHEHGGLRRHRHRAVGGRRTKRRAPCRAVPGERLRRIDRQFTGRAARRGEPGSCETLSLESPPEPPSSRHDHPPDRGAPSKSGRAGWNRAPRAYHCGSRDADATGFAGSCKCRSSTTE